MHGASATVRKFVSTFPNLNKSTTCIIRKKYGKELKQAEKKQREPKQLIANKKRGKPLLLGDIDAMVQEGKPLLLGDIDAMVQDYLRVSESLSS